MSRTDLAADLKAHLAQAGALADALAQDPGETADVTVAAPAPPQPATAEAASTDASFAFADYGKFYDWLRGNDLLGPVISATEFGGCDSILKACGAVQSPLAFTAYQLATPYLETAHTMQPIHELGGTAYFTRLYDVNGHDPERARQHGNVNPGDGARYCGRGYVQLTWQCNYARAGQALGVDLVGNPDLAMRPDIAAAIMTRGMAEGWFTGKKLADYLPGSGPGGRAQFREARRIINGQDRADDIAGYALDFQSALVAGGWRY